MEHTFVFVTPTLRFLNEPFTDLMLGSVFSGNAFAGMDASGHIAEETLNARYVSLLQVIESGST